MVMHARKPQRMNDGYFEKHQSHSYQKDSKKYSGGGDRGDRGDRLSNSTKYTSDRGDRGIVSDRGDRGDRITNSNKYSRRGSSERSDRSDRGDRLTNSNSYSRRGSGERERNERSDRGERLTNSSTSYSRRGNGERTERSERGERSDRGDRITNSNTSYSRRGNGDRSERSDRGERLSNSNAYSRRESSERSDRGERVARCGDWSEHVSSSGKMYYYNCKTEVSQWEKPKEWIERERNLARDQHREKDYRDKDRDRDRGEDRFSRSAYTKHSSSRGNARLRWNYDNDSGPPSHRRRLDGRLADNADMDISPGDSTPTSEASYSLSGTPTTHGLSSSSQHQQQQQQHNDQSTIISSSSVIGLPGALPRLASHPNVSNMSSSSSASVTAAVSVTMHYSSSSSAAASSSSNTITPSTGGITMLPSTGLAGTGPNIGSTSIPIGAQNNHRKMDSVSMLQHQHSHSASPNANQLEHHLNSNAPGPPKLGTKEQQEMKGGMHMRQQQQQQQQHHHLSQHVVESHMLSGNAETANHVLNSSNASLRDNPMNSPLYNLAHGHGMSPKSYAKSPITSVGNNAANNAGVHTANNLNAMSGGGGSIGSSCIGGGGPSSSYTCNTPYGHKTVEGSNAVGINSGHCSSSSLTNVNVSVGGNASSCGIMSCEGPPTPTQELDISGSGMEIQQQQQQQQRKLDGTSSQSLSTLQSCVTSSVQAARSQGPEISPKLAKYFRADLITHVTNWQADLLEKQALKSSEETHVYGDLQCTKVSAELKCARSLVRITEITATLQEQKIMYLRQQIRRIEESKSQNSFMSDDL